jgi:hypothetical protein
MLRLSRVSIIIMALAMMSAVLACGLGASATRSPSVSLPTGVGDEPSPPLPAMLPTATLVSAPQPARPTAIVQPAIHEARRLTLEWPPVIRAGDSDVVRLTLEIDDEGQLTPTAEIGGHQTTGQTVYVPDVYSTHNVVAVARLDMAGMEVRPTESVNQPLRPGESVTFYWSLHPDDVGVYRGTVWFYLRFVPLNGDPPGQDEAISSQLIEIDVVSFFGIKAGPTRWMGVAGTFVGTVLGFPFLEEILRLVWKRRGVTKGS